MQRIILVTRVVYLGGLVPTAWQSQTQQASEKTVPVDVYKALIAEYEAAQQDYRQAKTPAERQKALARLIATAAEIANRLLKVAKSQPDSPQALSALVWIATNVRHGKPLNY